MSSSPPSIVSSPSLRPSPGSLPPCVSRSHALCVPLLLLLFLSPHSTTASPYHERDEHDRYDGPSLFEADGSSGGSSSRPSDTPPIALSNTGPTTGTETTADRQIRSETITSPQPTVPSPQIVSILQPTLPLPAVLATVPSTDQATSAPQPEPTISLENQNTRMMEIVANLTKKLGTPPGSGTGTDISISFTPDELKNLQAIIGVADQRLKANLDITRRQLMIPNGGVKITDVYNYDDTKQQRPENPRYHEEEVEVVHSTPAPEMNSTVIDEATHPPTDPIPDDLVFPMSVESEIPDLEETGPAEPIDGELTETVRPAVCKLNTDDEVISIIWMFLQSRIREWGYDEEQSTVLVLATFGLILDSEHSLIEPDEPGFLEDITAAIQCLFRDCRRAMPNKRIPERQISMPSSPKFKREMVEYHSDLFECRCPSGYVFV